MGWTMLPLTGTEDDRLYVLELPESKLQRLRALVTEVRTEVRLEVWVQKVWDLLDYMAQEGIV